MVKLAVLAFGGNALIRGDQKGTFEEQMKNVYDTCKNVVNLANTGYNVVIGHGNGPQVGNVLLQHDAGNTVHKLPIMPMDFCGAETQGSIAYMIEQNTLNILKETDTKRNVISMVTEVFVDPEDPAFKNPTKPVGPFYPKDVADQMVAQEGWKIVEDPRKRGWRRVVPSPQPMNINNWEIVKQLADAGHIVITVGGGGIPVCQSGPIIKGVEAVIDKDLASSLLAQKIKADEFYILTDIPKVCLNLGKENEKRLDSMTVAQAEQYLKEGQFAEGSMAPKVRAAVAFVKNGGQKCIITEARCLGDKTQGTEITA